MNPGWDAYLKKRTLAAKRLAKFVFEHPEGVTQNDLTAAGLTLYGIDRLMKLGVVKATQVKEPERGSRCYHWLWKPNMKG